jgi:hypothetical protein
MEVSIADQVFKITLFVAPKLSKTLILGTTFMEEHVKSLLSLKILTVLSSGVSIPLVDDTRRSTSAVELTKANVIPPTTEIDVLFEAHREGLSLLKPLYVTGRLMYACNGVSCFLAPGESF